jgi:hypothetical protein
MKSVTSPRLDLEQFYGKPVESYREGPVLRYFSEGKEIGRLSFKELDTYQRMFDAEIELMTRLKEEREA